MLERGYYGACHKMSVKHPGRYADEFAGLHNIRKLDTIDQMANMIRNMDGKQLPYRKLTA